jgi:hypothetical protein
MPEGAKVKVKLKSAIRSSIHENSRVYTQDINYWVVIETVWDERNAGARIDLVGV